MAENVDTPHKRARVADSSRPVVERLELPYRYGRLVGWLCLPPSGSATATVVVWGGFSGWAPPTSAPPTRSPPAAWRACWPKDRARVNHARSTGSTDEHGADGFARFLDAVTADARLGDAVGVQGSSFGGLFAAHLTARDDRVAACVVNGVPAAPRLPLFPDRPRPIHGGLRHRRRGPHDLHAGPTAVRTAAPRINCPVLGLHGGADALVTDPAVQSPFADAAGPRGELRTWPNGEHTLYNHAAERDATVADWFHDRFVPLPQRSRP